MLRPVVVSLGGSQELSKTPWAGGVKGQESVQGRFSSRRRFVVEVIVHNTAAAIGAVRRRLIGVKIVGTVQLGLMWVGQGFLKNTTEVRTRVIHSVKCALDRSYWRDLTFWPLLMVAHNPKVSV